ncbi:MAG: hypothetical protein M1838_000938 [Thelocarpon superellum]|nr:MAG: hypothetical protein M1838_000938 [Thelocarpon superellum]
MAFATKFFIDYPADRFSVNANANADAFGTSIIYETMVANGNDHRSQRNLAISTPAQHVQALLDLDRSKLTFSKKLERISKILGLLENEHSSSGEVTALVGKEEWALRWLLSKLNQISGEGVRSLGLDPENQKKPASWEELQNLVAALLLLLTSLVQRTKGWQLPKQSQQTEYARQYLKSVLRSEPAHAAATVGRWLHVLSIIHGNNAISPPQAIFKERPGLDAIIDVWENRLRRGEDKDEGKDAVIFATHCLCPALLLLNECDTESNFQVREDIIVAPLEQMLARQIILPGRTSFFGTAHEAAKAKPMVPSTEQASILHALLTPLRTDLALLLNDLPSTSGKRTEQPAQGLIALFKIAIRCSPSKVRREQGIDTQWLEALLLALAEVAEIHVAAPGSQRLTRAEVEFLIALLDASNERCIPLQTATVQRIVARYGGLFGEADEVEWSLCETAIRLNSNVFLVPIEVDTILPGSQRSKMTLAEPLLSEICSVDGACDEATREGHAPIQQMIFLPLMTAFAHARDLLGFLRQWHRGLAQLERRRSQLADQRLRKGRSVIALVEDDQVVGRLRTVLEISVTPTQIADFLEQMLSHLRVGTAAKVPPSNEASASAIVVDAVLQSIRRDEFRDAVADTVKFIYRTSLKHLIARAWPKHQRWRLWRILATIIEGWPHLSLDEDADELKTVATQAQELLAGVVADVKGGKDAKKCREAFCAFQFVLSNLSALTPTRGLKGHTLTTFGDMLANLETYLNLPAVHQQDDSTAKSPQDILVDSIWDGSVGHLMTAGSLGVALLALLFLQFPRVLLYVGPLSVQTE